MSKEVLIMRGLPGSGKSTYIGPVDSDGYATIEGKKYFVASADRFIVDNTNVSHDEMHFYRAVAEIYDAKVSYKVMGRDLPLEELAERNSDTILDRLYAEHGTNVFTNKGDWLLDLKLNSFKSIDGRSLWYLDRSTSHDV